MTDAGPSAMHLAEMTWPQVKAAMATAPLALIPVGSCEQHGHGMALGTDAVRAREFTRLLAERLAPRAVVAPMVNVGVSDHHMGLPGTITISPITFGQVVFEIAESLYRHGWRKMCIVNGHGGNDAAVEVATTRLRTAFPDLDIAWSGITPLVRDLVRDLATTEVHGHACEIEASQAAYLAPSLVFEADLTTGSTTRAQLSPAGQVARSLAGVHFRQPYHELHPTGALGDQTKADPAVGEKLISAALERLATFLTAFIDLPPRATAVSETQ